MLVVTVQCTRQWLESVEDQVPADVSSIVRTSKPDLMARGVALDLLQMAKRVGPQYEATNMKIFPRRKTSPWIASLPIIKGAIKPLS